MSRYLKKRKKVFLLICNWVVIYFYSYFIPSDGTVHTHSGIARRYILSEMQPCKLQRKHRSRYDLSNHSRRYNMKALDIKHLARYNVYVYMFNISKAFIGQKTLNTHKCSDLSRQHNLQNTGIAKCNSYWGHKITYLFLYNENIIIKQIFQ